MLVVIRFGSQLPVPGVNRTYFADWFAAQSNGAFNFFDAFTGGSFMNMSVFALNITPYITSSIIMQLLTIAIPKLEEMQKDGEDGRKKIATITRYVTVGLSLIEAAAMAIGFGNSGLLQKDSVVLDYIVVIVALTAGSAFVMWIGEQITEHGVGNGISIVLTINIVSRMPSDLATLYEQFVKSASTITLSVISAVVIMAIIVGMVVLVIILNDGVRRIPVQYAKKIQGHKTYGGQSTSIPLKINTAGVIPIIFASSILMLPVTLAQFVHVGWVQALAKFFGWGTWANTCLYAILIVIFTYFYTAITVNVTELADNMKKYGGFIPGIRPGEPTMRYVDKVLTRITLTGSVFLAVIAILPNFIGSITNIQGVYFGGTALLIIVGVALDTMRQAQSLMVTRNYQGFIK